MKCNLDKLKKVELRDGKKIVVTDKGDIEAEAIVVATGAHFRRLGCEAPPSALSSSS